MEHKINIIKNIPKETINNIIKNESYDFKLGYNNPYLNNQNNNFDYIIGQIVAIQENNKKTQDEYGARILKV